MIVSKGPPQFGQCSRSISNTRLSNWAQLMRADAEGWRVSPWPGGLSTTLAGGLGMIWDRGRAQGPSRGAAGDVRRRAGGEGMTTDAPAEGRRQKALGWKASGATQPSQRRPVRVLVGPAAAPTSGCRRLWR